MKAVFCVASPKYLRQAKHALATFVTFNPSYAAHLFQDGELPRSLATVNHWTGPGHAEGALDLLSRGYDQVVYIDADTETYAAVDFPERPAMIITPHLLRPRSDGGSMRQIRLMGVYNSGVFVVNNHYKAYSFLKWWLQQTIAFGSLRPGNGEVHEQGWMEFAPSFLGGDCLVNQDPGINMAYWRAAEYPLSCKPGFDGLPGSWFAGDYPLKIMHFSGCTKGLSAERMSSYHGVKVTPEAKPLFEAYKKAVYEE